MLLSLVIPVYNEQEALPLLMAALQPVLDGLGCDHELVFVDDGSRDATRRILLELASTDRRVKILGFSRNFGHQAAITAGLDFASGDAVVVIDADLQDPPELLPEMLRLFTEGHDVVSARRTDREAEGRFKRLSARLFYSWMRRAVDPRLQPEVGDFRLYSRATVLALRGFREQHRFLRGLVAWLGLKEAIVPFRRPARVAGETKYPLHKMLRLAWTAISSFSALPLKLGLAGGLLMTAFAALSLVILVGGAIVGGAPIPIASSMVGLQLLVCGVVLTSVGMVGDYVARIYEEVKSRPLYVLSDAVNIGRVPTPPGAVQIRSPVADGSSVSASPWSGLGRPAGPEIIQPWSRTDPFAIPVTPLARGAVGTGGREGYSG